MYQNIKKLIDELDVSIGDNKEALRVLKTLEASLNEQLSGNYILEMKVDSFNSEYIPCKETGTFVTPNIKVIEPISKERFSNLTQAADHLIGEKNK